ncbi:MAG: Peptidase PfpI [Patescibacteria group bacterium]|nr:Peptidase PfpI [Patescibacteria group bacterium]
MPVSLKDMKVAILATNMVEESELVEPRKALEEAGATTELISLKSGEITCAKHLEKGIKLKVDRSLADADTYEYDALLLPGGALNADALRMDVAAQNFARSFDLDGRPIAVICHGPWLLVSAGLVRERRLTSYHALQDDIRNAGGYWVDAPFIRDINWVSSRHPGDLPVFNQAMLALFADHTFEEPIIGAED